MIAMTVPSSRGLSPTRRQFLTGSVVALSGAAIYPVAAMGEEHDEITRSSESIHQERLFNAGPTRIYDALTVTQQFDKIIQLSGVMQTPALATTRTPTDISRSAGGAFALFGGYITGRQIELVPNELIVQAWRVSSLESRRILDRKIRTGG